MYMLLIKMFSVIFSSFCLYCFSHRLVQSVSAIGPTWKIRRLFYTIKTLWLASLSTVDPYHKNDASIICRLLSHFRTFIARRRDPVSRDSFMTDSWPTLPRKFQHKSSRARDRNRSVGQLFQFRELIQFPEQGVGEFAKTLPVYQWLLRNKSTEEYLFNTYDGNYWENVKPLNALADLYIAKGKYELAYLAQGKKIEKDLSAQFDNETNLLLLIFITLDPPSPSPIL